MTPEQFKSEERQRAIASARKWVKRAMGRFSATSFASENHITDVALRDCMLDELVKIRFIERDHKQNGIYHRIDNQIAFMDWEDAEMKQFPVWLPLGLNEKVYISPGNVIVLAGETNAGKTAFVLNVIYRNLVINGGQQSRVRLLNSEMHPAELKSRLLSIDSCVEAWQGLEPISRSRDFHQVIEPNSLNVIDFLENLDDFWMIGKKIEAIHNTLENGIAIVCLQKKKGEELARGGDFTLEKARLGLSLFYDGFANYMRITKCKAPVTYPNPQGQEIDFSIESGSNLMPIDQCGWQFVTKEQREARTKTRQMEARLACLNGGNRGFEG